MRGSGYCPHQPNEQQALALIAHRFLPADEPSEVFYGGAAGGGKSDWLLMGALEYVDVPGYSAVLFRRTFADLDLPGAIMARSKEWLTRWRPHGVRWNEQRKQWVFPNKATLQFGYLEAADDIYRYQSAEFQYIGFDELTQFDEAQYRYLFSRLRRPKLTDDTPPEKREAIEALSKVPLRMRSASNPGGRGHHWVKNRFPIDGKPRGRRVFIPAKIADNPHLDATAYRSSLSHLDDVTQKQLEDGDWNVAEGLAYTVTDLHLIDGFELRDSHERFEALDYGLNGCPWSLVAVDYEGNLVFADMLYVKDLLPDDVCEMVRNRRQAADGWGTTNVAHADPSLWHRTGKRDRFGAPAMLADEFRDAGAPVVPANNDPRAGMVRIRTLLKADPAHRFPSWHPRAGEPGAPRIFFHRSRCERQIEELRNAPTQPLDKNEGGEKVDPVWESRNGHAAAMTRYAVMTRPDPSKEPDKPIDDPRIEAMLRHEGKLREPATGNYVA